MTARQLQDLLRDVLEQLVEARDDEDDDLAELAERAEGICEVRTYREVEMLTTDMGLVVELDDGGEFQITIVRSRTGDVEEGA